MRLFKRICEPFERICKDLQDFGGGLVRNCEAFAMISGTLGEYLSGFARLWERICETLVEDLSDFGRGFVRLW